LLWNDVFWTLIWVNFVTREKQSLLYETILCCLGNAIFILGSQKLIFNNN
jgi:hypothetical protein